MNAPAPTYGDPSASPANFASGGPAAAYLVFINPDGTTGERHALMEGTNTVGRASEVALFARDEYLSPAHADFHVRGNEIRVVDRGSVNGVYHEISGATELQHDDMLRVGQELLRFQFVASASPIVASNDGTTVTGSPLGRVWGRLERMSAPGESSITFVLSQPEHRMGRSDGDILFPDDGYVSGKHARIMLVDGRCMIEDLGSSNGTYLRIRGEGVFKVGAKILMGTQPFAIQGP